MDQLGTDKLQMDKLGASDETTPRVLNTTAPPEHALPAFGSPAFDPALDPIERRRYPRIKCFLAIQLRPADQGLLLGKLSDVSLGGCGVESSTPVPHGTRVAVCPLAAAGEFWVEGVVVNTGLVEGAPLYRIGVRFHEDDIPTPNVKKFVRFVEAAAAKPEPSDSYTQRLARGKA